MMAGAQSPEHLEVAAAHGVGLLLVLLVARPQRQDVDEVERRGNLRLLLILRQPVLLVLGAAGRRGRMRQHGQQLHRSANKQGG